MFSLYEIVRLKNEKAKNLPIGTRGTILVVYDEPPLPLAYEVEFLDDLGSTLAILTLTENELEPVKKHL